jgi:hypothetical protein
MSEYYCNKIIEESGKLLDKFKWKLNNTALPESVNGGDYRAAQ